MSGPSSKSIAGLGKQSSNVEQNVQHLMVDGGAQYVPKGSATSGVKAPKLEAEPLFGHAPKSNVVDFEAEKLKRQVGQSQVFEGHLPKAAGAEGTHFPQGHGIRMSVEGAGSGHTNTTVGHGGSTAGGESASHLTSAPSSYGCSTPKVKPQKTPEQKAVSDRAKKVGKALSDIKAKEYAEDAVCGNVKAREIVLGKHDDGAITGYTNVAEDLKRKYFQLEPGVWDFLSTHHGEEEVWKVNKAFLNEQINNQNMGVLLSHDPVEYIDDIEAGGFYRKELLFLKKQGFEFEPYKDIWRAVRKK